MTDEIDTILDNERARDHAQAVTRGVRLAAMVRAVEFTMRGAGLPFEPRARALLFHALADELYGNAAIDIPPLDPQT